MASDNLLLSPRPTLAYCEGDLSTALEDFCGGPGRTIAFFGMTSQEYERVCLLNDVLSTRVTPLTCDIGDLAARTLGFDDVRHIRELYARAHIFNTYVYDGRASVRDVMMRRWRAARELHAYGMATAATQPRPPPDEGDMVGYLANELTVPHFVAAGW